MRKTIYLSFLISILVVFEIKADWKEIYDFHADSCLDMIFINNNTGFVSSTKAIYRTSNSGFNWVQVSNYSASNIQFLNEKTGFACSDFNTLKTSDAGLNWYLISDGPAYNFSIQMVDSLYGYASSYLNGVHYLMRTTDGAQNWVTRYAGIDSLLQICFFDRNNGTASFHTLSNGADYSYILKTSDGGLNWSLSFALLWYPISNFQKLDTNSALIGGNTYIMKTTNRGITWIQRYYFLQYNLNQISFINGTTGFASTIDPSEFSNILKTTNGGQNWITSISITNSKFSKIAVTNNFIAYALTLTGKLYKTTNGGVTFTNSSYNLVPDKFSLSQNYPNPFNPTTIINYQLTINSSVTLKVYNNLGNEVETLVNEKQNAGSYSVDFKGTSLPSGIYFYKLVTESFSETKKMILLK